VGNVGIWEILLLLLVMLIVFGPKRLPEMGRSLGKGMREFRDSVSGLKAEGEQRAADEAGAAEPSPSPTVVQTSAPELPTAPAPDPATAESSGDRS
jgi:sec-independent protein translocase protein TatA